MISLNSIPEAIAAIAAGGAVVVVDDADRENEGDLIFAAQHASPELVAFTIQHSSGYLCVGLPGQTCDRLDLPPMHHRSEDTYQTAYTVAVDAATGVSTGISATDRARTIQLLGDPTTGSADLVRPGHVLPLRARHGGVLSRAGHTEAAVDLARLAGLEPAGALCEVVSASDPTQMARTPELRAFADQHGLPLVSIADLIAWRKLHDPHEPSAVPQPRPPAGMAQPNARSSDVPTLRRVAQAHLPTRYGSFTAIGYASTDPSAAAGTEQLALVYGDLERSSGEAVTVRVHSECLTGEALGALRCDCGPQLQAAMAAVAEAGAGVIVYLRGHEGRGIGLLDKLRAYQLQDSGADTVEANLALGLPADARDYTVGARILDDLGIRSVRLLTNNPDKINGLSTAGIRVVERVPIDIDALPENLHYLRTKRDRMGHLLSGSTTPDSSVTPGDDPSTVAETA